MLGGNARVGDTRRRRDGRARARTTRCARLFALRVPIWVRVVVVHTREARLTLVVPVAIALAVMARAPGAAVAIFLSCEQAAFRRAGYTQTPVLLAKSIPSPLGCRLYVDYVVASFGHTIAPRERTGVYHIVFRKIRTTGSRIFDGTSAGNRNKYLLNVAARL